MTPSQRAEVRELEVGGPYKAPAKPRPITDDDRMGALMATLFAGSGILLYHNPEAWTSFAAGFLIVFVSSMTAMRR